MGARLWTIICVTIGLLTSGAQACLWDEDTLQDEQRGMPTVAAIIAGKYEQHSRQFYEHRIARMRELLERQAGDLAAMDNLAVALEKLGQVDEAIDLMQQKLKLDPNGYTTHANLGTFYFHRGQPGDLDRGIPHIERALEINPNAHFGRERWQLVAAKYIRDAHHDPSVLDNGSFVIDLVGGPLPATQEATPEWRRDATLDRLRRVSMRGNNSPETESAIQGIAGMIRFGSGRSPHLFYALGDLLASRRDYHLAYRAYRRAMQLGHPRNDMIKDAMDRVRTRHQFGTQFDEQLIIAEEREAAEWVKAFQVYEDDLVRGGVDTTVVDNYGAFYRKHGDVRLLTWKQPSYYIQLLRSPYGIIGAAVLALIALYVFSEIRERRRRAGATPAAA